MEGELLLRQSPEYRLLLLLMILTELLLNILLSSALFGDLHLAWWCMELGGELPGSPCGCWCERSAGSCQQRGFAMCQSPAIPRSTQRIKTVSEGRTGKVKFFVLHQGVVQRGGMIAMIKYNILCECSYLSRFGM
ncbi:hypothetical protein INR49_017328 [Caranx melampygus]|nr:hypothetical protein INR49_017328 [Caranx melampygus]